MCTQTPDREREKIEGTWREAWENVSFYVIIQQANNGEREKNKQKALTRECHSSMMTSDAVTMGSVHICQQSNNI